MAGQRQPEQEQDEEKADLTHRGPRGSEAAMI
jgi:hypothetical protein